MKENIFIVICIEFFILVTPLFFIAFDFWSGIRKAKQRHEAITSDKWRRTVTKLSKYYNALLALLVLDAMQMVSCWYFDSVYDFSIPLFPVITLLGAFGVAAIEIKSIYESADEKTKKDIGQVAYLAQEIGKHRTDAEEVAKAIIDYLNEHKETNEH